MKTWLETRTIIAKPGPLPCNGSRMGRGTS